MSQELVNNECMTTPEIKAKLERNVWEDVNPAQDKQTEEPWYPEIVGEEIIGTYLYKKECMGKYSQNIYLLEEEKTDKIRSVFGCAVLDKLFDYVEEGEYIKITFEGRKTTGNGNEFKDFKVQRRITY